MSGTEIDAEEAAQRLDQLKRLGFQLFQQKLYLQALEISGQIVELAHQLRGAQDEEFGVALLNRGRIYRLLGRNAECEADYLRALETLQRSPKPHPDQVMWLIKNLFALYSKTNRHAQAECYARKLLDLQRASLPRGDLQLADSMVSLAFLCGERGAIGESIDLLREALQIRRSTLGPNDPRTIQLRFLLESQQDA